MQVTIGTDDGKTFQTEIEDTSPLVGKKIGDEVEGGIIGLEGYTLEITGGSDRDGFPMRKSVEGPGRRKMLLEEGAGIEEEEKGMRRRKTVRGNTVSDDIQQLNTRVAEKGEKGLEELLSGEEEE